MLLFLIHENFTKHANKKYLTQTKITEAFQIVTDIFILKPK